MICGAHPAREHSGDAARELEATCPAGSGAIPPGASFIPPGDLQAPLLSDTLVQGSAQKPSYRKPLQVPPD